MRSQLILFVILFSILGLPAVGQPLRFTWDVDSGCAPLRVNFAIDTSSIDMSTVSTAEWNFGNGQTETAAADDTVSTVFQYNNRQPYSVTLVATGTNTYNTTGQYSTRGISKPLNSNFTIERNRSEEDYTYTFTPHISNADSLKPGIDYNFAWLYALEDDLDSNDYVGIINVNSTNPERAINQYTFADTGSYFISLRILEKNPVHECRSRTDTILNIRTEFNIPNVFSPNTTDYFIIDPENANISLSFKLFSRTGLSLYEQEAPIIYWDGRNRSGQDLGTGVYFYVVESTSPDPDGFYSKNGFIHIFR